MLSARPRGGVSPSALLFKKSGEPFRNRSGTTGAHEFFEILGQSRERDEVTAASVCNLFDAVRDVDVVVPHRQHERVCEMKNVRSLFILFHLIDEFDIAQKLNDA